MVDTEIKVEIRGRIGFVDRGVDNEGGKNYWFRCARAEPPPPRANFEREGRISLFLFIYFKI